MTAPAIGGIALIASVCHEANRQFCATVGDEVTAPWNSAEAWQRDAAIVGVEKIASGEVTRPEQSHESWSAHKLAEGWVYGPTKDAVAKTHPCLVPFSALPPEQQLKDVLFLSVASALLFGRYPTAGADILDAGAASRIDALAGYEPPDRDVVALPSASIAKLHEIADGIQHRDSATASQIRGIIDPKPPLDPPAAFNAPSPS